MIVQIEITSDEANEIARKALISAASSICSFENYSVADTNQEAQDEILSSTGKNVDTHNDTCSVADIKKVVQYFSSPEQWKDYLDEEAALKSKHLKVVK